MFIALSIFMGITSFSHAKQAKEDFMTEITKNHLIYKIIENHEYCVAAFDGNKIFIYPESIISTDNGHL